MMTQTHTQAATRGHQPGLVDPAGLTTSQRGLLRFVATWANVVKTPKGWGLKGDGTGTHFTNTTVTSMVDKGLVRKELARSRVWRLRLTGSGQNTLTVMDLRDTAKAGRGRP